MVRYEVDRDFEIWWDDLLRRIAGLAHLRYEALDRLHRVAQKMRDEGQWDDRSEARFRRLLAQKEI